MTAFKQLLASDIIVTPFEVNKAFRFTGAAELTGSTVGIDRFLGENIEEGAFNLDKLKSYAKNGLITLAIASAIFGGANLSNDQKKEAGMVIKTERAVDQDVKDMSQAQLALSLYKSHKKDKDLGSKIDSGLAKSLDDLIAKKQEGDTGQLTVIGKTQRQDIQNFVNKMTNANY